MGHKLCKKVQSGLATGKWDNTHGHSFAHVHPLQVAMVVSVEGFDPRCDVDNIFKHNRGNIGVIYMVEPFVA